MKQFAFLAGLPRAGSTLISSILNQNPLIYASPNSPVLPVAGPLEHAIMTSEQYLAYPKPEVVPTAILGFMNNYYSDIEKPFVIDKCRSIGLPENLDFLIRNLPYEPRVIMLVRSITDILASFANLLKNNSDKVSSIDTGVRSLPEFDESRPIGDLRADYLMRPKGPIHSPLLGVANALLESNRKYFYLIEYDNLIANPADTINGIYAFLGLEKFDHDYENIVNTTPENDELYGLDGMHDVRPKISKRELNKTELLSPYVLARYGGLDFWQNAQLGAELTP